MEGGSHAFGGCGALSHFDVFLDLVDGRFCMGNDASVSDVRTGRFHDGLDNFSVLGFHFAFDSLQKFYLLVKFILFTFIVCYAYNSYV